MAERAKKKTARKSRPRRDRFVAVDVGNTDTVIGLMNGREIVRFWRLDTRRQTGDEMRMQLRALMEAEGEPSLRRGGGSDDVAMRPRAQQQREGAAFATEARILPRVTAPELDTVQLDAQFTRQLEDVFAQEQLPLHHKEFIRRYFVTLSQGADRERDAP